MMADSVDRVFSHALSTVNKIRTGSAKPPTAVRLKLYGLYKQSMEGDVEGIMERSTGTGEEADRAREKWDAWKAQSSLSRTEAKRQYITTLIAAMHRYASPSPDAKELVSELEFVWDQVKSNVASSTTSSPQRIGAASVGPPLREADVLGSTASSGMIVTPVLRAGGSKGLGEAIDDEEDYDDDDDEFVDAQDSQGGAARPVGSGTPVAAAAASPRGDRRWRRSVEKALTRMTAEVAALREQLEARRLFKYSNRTRGLWAWLAWVSSELSRVVAWNLVILIIAMLWLRWRDQRRYEIAIRWLQLKEPQKYEAAVTKRLQHLKKDIQRRALPKIPKMIQ